MEGNDEAVKASKKAGCQQKSRTVMIDKQR